MNIFSFLMLYAGILATFYQFLMLCRLIASYQELKLSLARYVVLAIKALLFKSMTRKIGLCVIRLWYSLYALVLGIYLVAVREMPQMFFWIGGFHLDGLVFLLVASTIIAIHYWVIRQRV